MKFGGADGKAATETTGARDSPGHETPQSLPSGLSPPVLTPWFEAWI